jgi:Peptidase family C69
MVRAVLRSAVVASLVATTGYACTTIAVGKLASTDGSTMATHNADCLDCDFRIGKVPAKDWPEGALRPIVKFRAEFPRTGETLESCRARRLSRQCIMFSFLPAAVFICIWLRAATYAYANRISCSISSFSIDLCCVYNSD